MGPFVGCAATGRAAPRVRWLGVSLAEDSYLFTRVPDGARPIRPEP